MWFLASSVVAQQYYFIPAKSTLLFNITAIFQCVPKMINVGAEKRQLFQTISNKLWKAEVNIFPCPRTTLEYIPEECIDNKMFENKKICWIRLRLLFSP